MGPTVVALPSGRRSCVELWWTDAKRGRSTVVGVVPMAVGTISGASANRLRFRCDAQSLRARSRGQSIQAICANYQASKGFHRERPFRIARVPKQFDCMLLDEAGGATKNGDH